MSEALVFELELAEIPVVFKSSSQPDAHYLLKEMDGLTRDGYMKNLRDYMDVDEKGNVIGIKQFEGHQVALLSRCLFQKDGKTPVPETVIQSFSARVINSLFTSAQKLNGLLDQENQAKNDSGVSVPIGSDLP